MRFPVCFLKFAMNDQLFYGVISSLRVLYRRGCATRQGAQRYCPQDYGPSGTPFDRVTAAETAPPTGDPNCARIIDTVYVLW